MITGIHHFSIIASSEKCIYFYKKIGFVEEKRINRSYDTVVMMSGYGVGLEIFVDPSHPARQNPEPLGLRYFALKVDDVEDLGFEDDEIMADWNGKRYVIIRDPDGNTVQLCE